MQRPSDQVGDLVQAGPDLRGQAGGVDVGAVLGQVPLSFRGGVAGGLRQVPACRQVHGHEGGPVLVDIVAGVGPGDVVVGVVDCS